MSTLQKVLLGIGGVCVLALISVAAWKISTTPPCAPGFKLHTTTAYDYGLNPDGKFGFGYHTHTSCVQVPAQ